MITNTDAGVRYLFIVARKNPDILARVQERLHGDPRIEVITDRRHGERRRSTIPHSPDRRSADRRRPTNVWNDLTIYPTLVAQRHVDSYAELERKVAAAVADQERLRERIDALMAGDTQLRGENARLREETAELQRRLAALSAADAEFKADVAELLRQAEHALSGLIASFRRLVPEGRQSQKETRLRSV